MSRAPQQAEPWQIHVVGPTATMLLDGRFAPCRMWCAFCPRSFDATRQDPPEDVSEIVAAFDAALEDLDVEELYLVSDDILAFPALDTLLDHAEAAGKRIVLGTPALSLSEPARVEALAKRPVTVALTPLHTEAQAWGDMVGNPLAPARIERAMALMKTHGVPMRVQVVVTAANVANLPDLVAHLHDDLGVSELEVHLFYPDLASPPDAYLDQFPAYADVQAALEAIDAMPDAPALRLGNAPLCQLDFSTLRSDRIHPHGHQASKNRFGTPGIAACRTCSAAPQCVRIHPAYAARRDLRPIEQDRIDANARHIGAVRVQLGPADTPGEILPGQGIPANQGIPRGQGLLPDAPRPKPEGTKGTILPGQGIPRGAGLLPDAPRPVHAPPPTAPVHPDNQTIPKSLGKGRGTPGPPPNQRIPRGHGQPVRGVLPGEGVPRHQGRLPTRRPPRYDDAPNRFPLLQLRSHGAPVTALAFSPDNARLAALVNGEITVWDLHDRPGGWVWRGLRALGFGREPGQPRCTTWRGAGDQVLAWTSPERLLTTGGGGRADLIERDAKAKKHHTVTVPTSQLGVIALGPEGRVFCGGRGLTAHRLDGRFDGRWLPRDVAVTGLSVDASGRVLATIQDACPRLFSAHGTELPCPIDHPTPSAALSWEGTWLAAVTDDEVKVWDRVQARLRWRRQSGPHLRHVAITTDERHLVVAGGGGHPATGTTVRLWNIDAGMRRADMLGDPSPVKVLAMAPDGRRFATADTDGAIWLWDLTPEISQKRKRPAP